MGTPQTAAAAIDIIIPNHPYQGIQSYTLGNIQMGISIPVQPQPALEANMKIGGRVLAGHPYKEAPKLLKIRIHPY